MVEHSPNCRPGAGSNLDRCLPARADQSEWYKWGVTARIGGVCIRARDRVPRCNMFAPGTQLFHHEPAHNTVPHTHNTCDECLLLRVPYVPSKYNIIPIVLHKASVPTPALKCENCSRVAQVGRRTKARTRAYTQTHSAVQQSSTAFAGGTIADAFSVRSLHVNGRQLAMDTSATFSSAVHTSLLYYSLQRRQKTPQ